MLVSRSGLPANRGELLPVHDFESKLMSTYVNAHHFRGNKQWASLAECRTHKPTYLSNHSAVVAVADGTTVAAAAAAGAAAEGYQWRETRMREK